ncbi:MAG: BatD family protein, partial [Fusobacteriaceae bacterium]
EFYSCYCEFMKEKYGFNPKVHSEIKLINEELKEINREIELSRFKGMPLNTIELIKKIEKYS